MSDWNFTPRSGACHCVAAVDQSGTRQPREEEREEREAERVGPGVTGRFRHGYR